MAGNATKALKVILTGDAKGAVNAFKSTEKGAGSLGAKLKTMGAVAGTALVATATAVVGFGKKAADTFKNLGVDTLKLQRVTGLTAEAASKLRFEFQQTGIKADVGARSVAMYGKKLAASKDTVKDFGIKTRDSRGHLLPMSELLKRAADRLSHMKNTTERNALAMKLFGKGGIQMTKLLDKGRGGMAKLAAEAKKYGLVLTNDNLAAVKKSIKAHRQQEAAMQGLQVQIGMHVLPVLTKFTTFLATQLPKVTNWIKTHKQSGKIIGGVFVGALVVATGAMLGLAAATLAATWEFVVGALVVAALVAGVIYAYKHFKGFRDAVNSTVKFLKSYAWPVIKLWAKGIKLEFQLIVAYTKFAWKVVSAVVKAAVNAVRWVISVGMSIIHGDWSTAWSKIKSAASTAFDSIKTGVSNGITAVTNYMKDLPGKAVTALGNLTTTLYQKGKDLMGGLIDGVKALSSDLLKAIVSKIPGGGLISKVAGKVLGLAGSGKKGLEGTGSKSLSPGSLSLASGGGLAGASSGPTVIQLTVQSVLDGRVVAESTRNYAIDKQRTTGKPWLPAMA